MRATGLRLELFVDDIEQAARFFQSVLGFTLPVDASFDAYLQISSGAVTIGLSRYADLPEGHEARCPGPEAVRGVGVEIVLEVDDIDAAYDRARGQTERIEPLTERPWGLRDFRVVAPGGYYLRVTNVA